MRIRLAKTEDFEAINHLMMALNETDTNRFDTERQSIFLKLLDDPRNHIFVGEHNGLIVTTCYLNIIPNITWGPAPYALIENVVTLESHRRRGYGQACLKFAIDYAFSNGCFKVMLLSSQRNNRTINFYGSVGLVQSKDGYVNYKVVK